MPPLTEYDKVISSPCGTTMPHLPLFSDICRLKLMAYNLLRSKFLVTATLVLDPLKYNPSLYLKLELHRSGTTTPPITKSQIEWL